MGTNVLVSLCSDWYLRQPVRSSRSMSEVEHYGSAEGLHRAEGTTQHGILLVVDVKAVCIFQHLIVNFTSAAFLCWFSFSLVHSYLNLCY